METYTLVWKEFTSFLKAIDYCKDNPCVYFQASKDGHILRVGKAELGLATRYNLGYQQTIEAAMWDSGNKIFIAFVPNDKVKSIEDELIYQWKPQLNKIGKRWPPTQRSTILHNGCTIRGAQVERIG